MTLVYCVCERERAANWIAVSFFLLSIILVTSIYRDIDMKHVAFLSWYIKTAVMFGAALPPSRLLISVTLWVGRTFLDIYFHQHSSGAMLLLLIVDVMDDLQNVVLMKRRSSRWWRRMLNFFIFDQMSSLSSFREEISRGPLPAGRRKILLKRDNITQEASRQRLD